MYGEPMALNIKNLQVERLAAEVAALAGETKTEAIGRALAERKRRLASRVVPVDRRRQALRFLEAEVWPQVPADQLGRRLTADEEDQILGYGPDGT